MTVEAQFPEVGELIDGTLHIERYIGRGAAGQVFEATRISDGKRVAVKWYDPNLQTKENRRILFARRLRENEIGSEQEHPNVVRTLGVGWNQDGSPRYIVMEYLEGRTLDQTEAIEGKGGKGVYSIMQQLIDGVLALHSSGIIHRDIKPANIMSCTDGRIVLLDLGVARPLQDSTITESGTFLGTLDYSAPEWLFGKGCTAASDVYSLGAVLVYLLTGNGVFEKYRPWSIRVKAIESEPPRLPLVHADPRIGFAYSVAIGMLEKDPLNRPRLEEVQKFFRLENKSPLWKKLRKRRIVSILSNVGPTQAVEKLAESLSAMTSLDGAISAQDLDQTLASLSKTSLEASTLKNLAKLENPQFSSLLKDKLPKIKPSEALAILDQLRKAHWPIVDPVLVEIAKEEGPNPDVLKRLAGSSNAQAASLLKEQLPHLSLGDALAIFDQLHEAHRPIVQSILVEIAELNERNPAILKRLAASNDAGAALLLKDQLPHLDPGDALATLDQLHEAHRSIVDPILVEIAKRNERNPAVLKRLAASNDAGAVSLLKDQLPHLDPGDALAILDQLHEAHQSIVASVLLEIAKAIKPSSVPNKEVLKRLAVFEDQRVARILEDTLPILEPSVQIEVLEVVPQSHSRLFKSGLDSLVSRAQESLEKLEQEVQEIAHWPFDAQVGRLIDLGAFETIRSKLGQFRAEVEKADSVWEEASQEATAIAYGLVEDDPFGGAAYVDVLGPEVAWRAAKRDYDRFLLALLKTPDVRETLKRIGPDLLDPDVEDSKRIRELCLSRMRTLEEKVHQLNKQLEDSYPDLENDVRLTTEIGSLNYELQRLRNGYRTIDSDWE